MDYSSIDQDFNSRVVSKQIKMTIIWCGVFTFLIGFFELLFGLMGGKFLSLLGLQPLAVILAGLVLIVMSILIILKKSRVCATIVFLDYVPLRIYLLFCNGFNAAVSTGLGIAVALTYGMICTYIYQYQKNDYRSLQLSKQLQMEQDRMPLIPPKQDQGVTQNLEDFATRIDMSHPSSTAQSHTSQTSSPINPSLFEDD